MTLETALDRSGGDETLSLRGSLGVERRLGSGETAVSVSGERLASKAPPVRPVLGVGAIWRSGGVTLDAALGVEGFGSGDGGYAGWSRRCRVIVLRWRLPGAAAMTRVDDGQGDLFWADAQPGTKAWEFAVLATSFDLEVGSLAQLYRDRADAENSFDELKNQWGWGGFTTRDLKHCQHMVRLIALTYNWWSLFVRLADPNHNREAITSRPLLLHEIARQTQHAGQTRLTVTSSHGRRRVVVAALRSIIGFFRLMRSAEQLSTEDRRRRILPAALKEYLRGRQQGRQPWLPPPRPALAG